MPSTDTVEPLCSVGAFTAGAFSDLVIDYPPDALADVMVEATRKCEDATDRRLAPFTGLTETTRAAGIDPDEYGGVQGMPVSIQATLGQSEATALGMTNLVRHTWLSQYPPRYPDLWEPNPNMQVLVIRSYGGTQQLSAAQILDGPDDTGHVWFQLGQFIPVGSRIRVTYGGGYTVATPGSLKRASEYIGASIVARELNPDSTQHDPDALYATGLKWLGPFMRDGGGRR
jgi:hypothetical protein